MKKRRTVAWLVGLSLCFSCTKDYSYERGVPQNYLLKDDAGDCTFAKAAGSYQAGRLLTGSDYLEVSVHIGQPGAYSIFSDSLNGFFFSAKGEFADTGRVELKLPSSGKPLVSGPTVFTLRYGSSSCQVVVAVQDTISASGPVAVMPSNPDYFPLAAGNRWVYDDLGFPGDSIITTVLSDTLIGSLVYKRLDDFRSFYPAKDSRFCTKAGAAYFRYASVSGFTSAFDYAPSLYDDFPFLRESLTTGDTWLSNTYRRRTSFDTKEKLLRYTFTCLDSGASLKVNNWLFSQVYKIQMVPEVAEAGQPLTPTGEIHTLYYARGVGLVYQEFFNGVLPHPVLAIRRWVVN